MEIEDLHQQVRDLEEALKSKQEELDVLKEVFLKHIPHEVRTPMNSIIGFCTLLAEGSLSVKQKKEYLEYINSSGKELLSVIENLIDLALLQSGQIMIQVSSFSVEELFKELLRKYSDPEVNGIRKEIKIKYAMNAVDAPVNLDRLRLKQILSHLIHNAVKFTNKGVVEFGCHKDDGGYMGFYVKDSGPGVKQEDRALIFNSFNKQYGPPSERNRGLGLGLSIAKGLVDRMGGQLSYKPNDHCGSIFSFSLPISLSDSKTRKERKPKSDPVREKVSITRKNLAI